jgi:chloramphenicol 3-O phosphotransferase
VTSAGQIVVLNGAPRSGKTSIARAIQSTSEEPWINLGVDAYLQATPERYWPGIGLRPGGERPDLEPLVETMFLALYDGVAAHSRLGLNVVVDVGHHDDFAAPRRILPKVAVRLAGLPVLFVGVRCAIDVIMQRRGIDEPGRKGRYLKGGGDGTVPEPVLRWQQAVHDRGFYDLEVNSTSMTATECADAIQERLASGPPPVAFRRLAAESQPPRPPHDRTS